MLLPLLHYKNEEAKFHIQYDGSINKLYTSVEIEDNQILNTYFIFSIFNGKSIESREKHYSTLKLLTRVAQT